MLEEKQDRCMPYLLSFSSECYIYSSVKLILFLSFCGFEIRCLESREEHRWRVVRRIFDMRGWKE